MRHLLVMHELCPVAPSVSKKTIPPRPAYVTRTAHGLGGSLVHPQLPRLLNRGHRPPAHRSHLSTAAVLMTGNASSQPIPAVTPTGVPTAAACIPACTAPAGVLRASIPAPVPPLTSPVTRATLPFPRNQVSTTDTRGSTADCPARHLIEPPPPTLITHHAQ